MIEIVLEEELNGCFCFVNGKKIILQDDGSILLDIVESKEKNDNENVKVKNKLKLIRSKNKKTN